VDWKYGDGYIVEAENNDQARFYLAGAVHGGHLPKRESYVFWIFQPSAKLSPSKYASRAVYTRKDLERFTGDLADSIGEWRAGRAKYNAGAHCAHCKGKLGCPAYKELLTTATKVDIKGMTPAELGYWKGMRPALTAFMNEVDAAAYRNASAGRLIPGYKLEPALGDSAYVDEGAALAALGRLGVAADRRTVTKAISATQALVALEEIGTPKDVIERFAKRHIHRPNNGERLAKLKEGEPSGDAMSRLATAMKARGY
jgi:hypothetical protein